ncbi:GRAM domain-containing protein [Dehalobacter sp. TBBPA1]|uniref:GRAM domain-containing protein n=1 Tax=Dehalobacter sp. TBBPA1 TaxID=3235037 RepID=UPI0034A22A71
MKNSIKTFFLAGIPFGIVMGLFLGITNNLIAGIMSGIVIGILFGLIIAAYVLIQNKRNTQKNPIDTSNNIIMEGAANHFKGVESVGGWLCLTKNEIIFKSHNLNIQKHETVIPLNRITGVKTSLTFGFIPNGMQIFTNTTTDKFVVNNRKSWVNKINEAISEQ